MAKKRARKVNSKKANKEKKVGSRKIPFNIKYYLEEMFEPTIMYCGFSALVGVVGAWHYGNVVALYGVLAIIGTMLAQMSINLIDDYDDYVSGLDKDTVKTKFSGGSALIVDRKIDPKNVRIMGFVAFAIAAVIGLYLVSIYPVLIPLVLIGGATILFYAKFLSKIPYFSEPLTTINFFLVAMGGYIAAGGPLMSAKLFAFAALAIGFQVGIAVVVNFLPDRDADRKHGRRNAIAMMSSNRGAAIMYLIFEYVSFALVVAGVMARFLPVTTLLVLITLPMVAKVFKGMFEYKDPRSYEKYMATAALAEFAFIVLLAVAFVL